MTVALHVGRIDQLHRFPKADVAGGRLGIVVSPQADSSPRRQKAITASHHETDRNALAKSCPIHLRSVSFQ